MYAHFRLRSCTRYKRETVYITLCQCKWVDGSPKSSTIGYLGSFILGWVNHPKMQAHFWHELTAKLDDFKPNQSDRSAIISKIANKVGIPTP